MFSLTNLWEYHINLFESIFLIIFLNDKLENKRFFSRNSLFLINICFVATDSLLTYILNILNVYSGICYIVGTVSFIVYALIIYSDEVSKRVFWSVFYTIILITSDIISVFFFFINVGKEFDMLLYGGSLRVPITLFYIACIVLFVVFSHFIRWRKIFMSPIHSVVYFFISMIGLCFGQYIVTNTIQSYKALHDKSITDKMITISSIYYVFFIVLQIYIYILSYTRQQNEVLLLEKERLLLEEIEYRNLITTAESLRKTKHDLQHHLNTIKYMIENNSISELYDYVNNYIGMIDTIHTFVSTGNMAIDSTLSTNISFAINKGINVNYSVSIPKELSIEPIELTTLMGNMWLNAIEACDRIDENNISTERYIDFYIKPTQDMLLISMENTFNGEIKRLNDYTFQSIKEGRNSHGLGLKRIHEIVEKYDGMIDCNTNDNIFFVHIVFPLEVVAQYENSDNRG